MEMENNNIEKTLKKGGKDPVEPFYKELGSKIKKAREEAGCTQLVLANELGLTPSAIANYELGFRQIPVHMLLQLAKRFGKPLDFFLGPVVKTDILAVQSMKSALERFSEATYINATGELAEGKLLYFGIPPMVPVPPEIAQGNNFAIRKFNEETGVYNYYICKEYIPHYKKYNWTLYENEQEPIPPEPEDLVLAEKGDGEGLEIVQFKDVIPSQMFKDKGDIVNVRALIIARVERLVK
jgi:transcriptional regulator with XRE-family HTH domain